MNVDQLVQQLPSAVGTGVLVCALFWRRTPPSTPRILAASLACGTATAATSFALEVYRCVQAERPPQ